MDRYGELREAAEKAPIVDAHAHNLVAVDSAFPFLRAFSEAEGDALPHTVHTLSFKRSVRDIASLYGCGATLDDIEKYRRSHGLQSIATKCFAAANMSTLFVDDGIEFDKMHNWEWHSQFAPAVGRILRIEYLAEKILNEELANGSEITLESFSDIFTTELKSPKVAGKVVSLKSIAAYRSGLEIDTQVSKKAAEEGLLEDFNGGTPIRIRNKNIIDYIFTSSLAVALQFNLPMQIHTGFGDKDLNLSNSNPLLLRGVLEDKRFSKCQFVLLHASYPYSREASYLSSVYSQVYLDFGLAVPKLSVHGMVSSVKELLELAPINKVMFSSDGYAFPETFYLGAKRAREVIYFVLSNACDSGDFTIIEAIEATEKIFWKNALELYSFQKVIGSFDYKRSLTISPKGKSQEYDTMVVRVIWVDNSGQHRCRVIPTKRFYEVVKNIGVGLTVASMGMSSHSDGPSDCSGLTAVGEIRLVPDLSTIQNIPWINQEEMVLADMQLPSGASWEYCPRDTLRRVSQTLKEEFNLVMNAGFENEFYLLRKTVRKTEEWVSFDSTLYSSTSGFDAASPILKEMLSSLHSMGIFVDQMHAESGNGQFEVVLGHKVCHLAADDLIFAREAIRAVSRKHGLLATFLPKFSLDSVGSGCHVHLSLWKDGKNVFMASDLSETPYGVSKIGENFMAGVFHHLPSILAIISPLPNSYDRIQPDTWSGAYHCWGTENREAPIRIACHPGSSTGVASNFEIKSFDGCANPHIGLASILAAGIDGLRKNLALLQPTNINPSGCDSKVPKLPKDLSESIAALEGDTVLQNSLGEKLVKAIIGVRRAEIKYYSTNGRAIEQLIHKY